ncbi:MAG: winged helix DNA-binding domain-containing protein [Fimbriimonas sp.]
MVAVQTQYAASLTTAIAARTRKLPKDWESKALAPGGSIVKSWSVRHTLHAHTKEDHDLLVGCVGPRHVERYRTWFDEIVEGGFDSLMEQIYTALQDGPLTREELHAAVPALRSIPHAGWGRDTAGLAFQRKLCIVGRGSEQKFAALLPVGAGHRLGALLRRYLQAFAPATKKDFYYWAGLGMVHVKAAFEELASELESCEIDGKAGQHFILKTQPVPEPRPLGLKLLAKFDALLLAHHDKSLFLPPEDRSRVFRIAGQVEATVLSEGRVIGTWRLRRLGSRAMIAVEPFREFKAREKARLDKEAARMAKLLGFQSVQVELVSPAAL